jgi:hypothetical protein
MERLLKYSLRDCGYELVEKEQAEVVIWIQYGDPQYQDAHKEQKHVLLDTEDWIHRPGCCKDYLPFSRYCKAWGFDIKHPYTDYFYLGYHREFITPTSRDTSFDVGMLGGITQRRLELHDLSRNRFKHLASWNYNHAMLICSQCRINIHVHAYEPTVYTPWDRYARFLHNGIFFISEECYCPIKSVPMFKLADYDSTLDFYLSKPQSELKEMALAMHDEYKRDYVMAKQMETKIKEVFNV